MLIVLQVEFFHGIICLEALFTLVYVDLPFFFSYSILCYEIYCVLFNRLSRDGHLGGFHSFTNGISVAIYILVYVFLYTLMAFRVYC